MSILKNITTLDELFDAMKADKIESWDDLPAFGGEALSSTSEIWSWDSRRLIVGNCSDDLQIVDREDW